MIRQPYLQERLKMFEVQLSMIQRDRDRIMQELLNRNKKVLDDRRLKVEKIKSILDSLGVDDPDYDYTKHIYETAVKTYLYYCARHKAMEDGKAPNEIDLMQYLDSIAMIKDYDDS